MHRTRSQLAVTLVAFVLGLLVVAQLRSQATAPALAGVSAQDLTILIANLNTRNERDRAEIEALEGELAQLRSDRSRGQTSIEQLRGDLQRIRAFAGLEPVVGQGVSVTVNGRISGQGVQALVNELWNAGAEAVAIGEVRVVPGTVVAGPPGGLSIEGSELGDPFEVRAIGAQQTLTGSLTRIGGIIAQLGATEELATLTVTPVDRIVLPATDQDLIPDHGGPRL
jgi:uncharacterized protein YlxW (UPF0749 family)